MQDTHARHTCQEDTHARHACDAHAHAHTHACAHLQQCAWSPVQLEECHPARSGEGDGSAGGSDGKQSESARRFILEARDSGVACGRRYRAIYANVRHPAESALLHGVKDGKVMREEDVLLAAAICRERTNPLDQRGDLGQPSVTKRAEEEGGAVVCTAAAGTAAAAGTGSRGGQ